MGQYNEALVKAREFPLAKAATSQSKASAGEVFFSAATQYVIDGPLETKELIAD